HSLTLVLRARRLTAPRGSLGCASRGGSLARARSRCGQPPRKRNERAPAERSDAPPARPKAERLLVREGHETPSWALASEPPPSAKREAPARWLRRRRRHRWRVEWRSAERGAAERVLRNRRRRRRRAVLLEEHRAEQAAQCAE